MTADNVACPTCDGTGGGSGFKGECGDCLGSGEVTRTRRATLLRVRAASPVPILPGRAARPKSPTVQREQRSPRRVVPPGTWPRRSIPEILPWVTYRQADSWGRLGLWKPEFPAAGMGTKAVVSAADLEGVGLLGRLAPFLLGQHASKGPRMMPLWPDLRQACKLGGVWIAASDSLWVPWEPNCPVPTVGVIVDVDAVMVEVHDRIAKHGPGRLSSS